MDNQNSTPEENLSFWDQHRFLLLIALTIIISLILVTVSLVLYSISGAAQLDLSRPGYQSVVSEAESNDPVSTSYSAVGAINRDTIKEFQDLYNPQVESVTTVDAFGGDPLNPADMEFRSSNSQ